MGEYIPADAGREIHVLVTGAGPFFSNKTNPSEQIARALPPTLYKGFGSRSPLTIHIHATPEPWRVAYGWVREHVPPMLFTPSGPSPSSDSAESSSASHDDGAQDRLDKPAPSSTPGESLADSPSVEYEPRMKKARPNYDLVLFIGMASHRTYYSFETRAHRDGYSFPDVDGQTMEQDDLWKTWNAPALLETGFDAEDVWRRWKSSMVEEDLRPSYDAGHFLCDFIYYTGLVEYWKQNPRGDRPVTFLHVPGDYTEEALQRGVKVASGLIVSLVQSHIEKGKFG